VGVCLEEGDFPKDAIARERGLGGVGCLIRSGVVKRT